MVPDLSRQGERHSVEMTMASLGRGLGSWRTWSVIDVLAVGLESLEVVSRMRAVRSSSRCWISDDGQPPGEGRSGRSP
jgi:hypothetical protein